MGGQERARGAQPKAKSSTAQFDLSSIPATAKDLFNLTSWLTKRDEWAGTFEKFIGAGSGSVSGRTTPRTDGARVRAVPLASLSTMRLKIIRNLENMHD